MPHAAKARDVIIQLKKVRAENGYSHQRIYNMVEDSGGVVSLATIKRVFAEGSEDQNFRYEDSIKPIAAVLLDINTEAMVKEDNSEIAALKAIILAKEEALESEKRKVQYLINENERMTKLLDERGEYMRERADYLRRKDRYIAALSVVAGLFVLYLLAFDLPNAAYGLTSLLFG